ncbi:hypothetical protein [Streptacidiphilus sp. EB129]|uniref:hypothetical protein n=1 Tax=Streptacidiphilus sp. EB129 TaxID=3156262 RepID=UPI003514B9CE
MTHPPGNPPQGQWHQQADSAQQSAQVATPSGSQDNAQTENKGSEDHPFSWILTAAGCAAFAVGAQTSLWDDQIAGSSTRGRYRAMREFMQALGPNWTSVVFGVAAALLLLVGIREIRAAYKD